jgi:hypothetical protein
MGDRDMALTIARRNGRVETRNLPIIEKLWGQFCESCESQV